MKQSIKTIFGELLFILLFANVAMGVETFGPKKYIRSDGVKDVYTESFKTISGPGKIIVRNGEYNGQKRVPYAISSAKIFINGTEIFGPKNFSNAVYYLEADINLNEHNSLKVELASKPGDFLTVSIEQEITAPLNISIASPANGAAINKTDVLVEGAIISSQGKEVWVTVNGVLALVNGNKFIANHVPLEQGENTITAIATDADGNTSSASVTVNSSPVENYIRIKADSESGVSPFEATLKIDGSFTFTAHTPTCTGPGTVEITNGIEENEFNIKITTPGTYYFTSSVEFEGQTYSDAIVVYVAERQELDVLLKSKWNDMKQALMAGDIEKALTYHQKAVREKYSAIYSALGNELSSLVQQMKEISPVYFYDVLAKYRIRQDHNINGQIKTITYYVYFSKDEKGIWLIENY